MESELVKKAQAYAEDVFKDRAFKNRDFHNIDHTHDVIQAVEEIGTRTELSADEMESALIAAWLHDIGYMEGKDDHEKRSADKARELLISWNASQKKVGDVTEAIMATKMPQRPRSLVSKVLCDADLFHLSAKDCNAKSEKLRDEMKKQDPASVSDEEWLHRSIDFMENHQYHTPYGQTVLQQGKKKNIKSLRKMLKPDFSEKKFREMEEDLVKLRVKLEKEKILKPDRGIETLFRTTSHNHLMLSQMADNKANILITINSIILSILVSVLVRKLEENPLLIVPTIMLVSVCLATMVFAILSTRPNVSEGRFTREDIKNKRTNLLFFGNFHGMSADDYDWSMKEMMKDADYLYGSLIKDIYYLGKVLARKYKFLRIAYNTFMFGFVLAILAFTIVFILTPRGL